MKKNIVSVILVSLTVVSLAFGIYQKSQNDKLKLKIMEKENTIFKLQSELELQKRIAEQNAEIAEKQKQAAAELNKYSTKK